MWSKKIEVYKRGKLRSPSVRVGEGIYDFLKPNPRNMKIMKAFADSASKSRGPLDLGKNMLKSYFGAGVEGGSLDLHKAIGKLPKPKKGFTLPGHKYTGPYNPLEKQVKWDPITGDILEIYEQPTGSTDAIAMQHDVDYSVCKDDVKCKNKADQKMVKALDAVPYNERQWGHWLARNAINSKQTLGLGLGVPKNGKSRRVKKTGKKTGKKN